jgi:hypothetical protein
LNRNEDFKLGIEVVHQHQQNFHKRKKWSRLIHGLPDKLVKAEIFPHLPLIPSWLSRIRRVCKS